MSNNQAGTSTSEVKTLREVEVYSRHEVRELLSKYQAYKTISSQIVEIEKKIQEEREVKVVARGGWLMGGGKMVSHDPHAQQRGEIAKLLQEQNNIGLSMKFQNPLIWAMYKHEAYVLEPGAIGTVDDLVLHCQVDGICHKRIAYINTWLHSHGESKGLDDGLFEGATPIPLMYSDVRFTAMLTDMLFMKEWSEFENHEQGKWYRYAQV